MDEEHLRWVSAVLVSGVAAAYDLRSGHIPNGVVALGLALAAAAAGVAVAGGDGLRPHPEHELLLAPLPSQ